MLFIILYDIVHMKYFILYYNILVYMICSIYIYILHVCMWTTCLPGAYEVKKRASDPPGQVIESREPPCGRWGTEPGSSARAMDVNNW